VVGEQKIFRRSNDQLTQWAVGSGQMNSNSNLEENFSSADGPPPDCRLPTAD
jgi:hypothetical protein